MNAGLAKVGSALGLGMSLLCLGALGALALHDPSLANVLGVAGCFIGIAGCGRALYLSASRKQAAVERFMVEVCQIPPQQFAGEIDQLLPAIDADQPYGELLQHLRGYLVEVGLAYQAADREKAKADVRYRKAAAQSEQLSEILHGLHEPVLAVNEYNELTVANESARELFRFDVDECEQQAIETLVQCQELIELLQETRTHRASVRRFAEVAVAGADDSQRWFNATAESIGDQSDGEDDRDRGAVVVLRDITDRKEIQRRHAEFVSSVSHEMKTPLASIKAYVELLADGDAEDEATRDEFLNVINGQAERLRRLIDNLLNIARIEAGVVQVAKEEQSLNDVLEEAFQVVQPAAEQKNIQYVSEFSPLFLGVLIDRDMILQAAINLLSNAVKYTPDAGSVTIRSRTSDDCVVFEVEDTGVGLAPEDAQRVFDKFYRVKKDQSMAPGTGLGLPLAKHIVEDVHGGTLSVESAEGSGSTFRVSIPTTKRT